MENYQTDFDANRLLYIDIETARLEKSFIKLSPHLREAWGAKCRKADKPAYADEYFKDAALYAEFSKIICISVGYLREGKQPAVQSYCAEKEKDLLIKFCEDLSKFIPETPSIAKNKAIGLTGLCGHNIKGFDLPFISKRLFINNIGMPRCLQMYNMKPWENPSVDTAELWKFGGYSPSSLSAISAALGTYYPKDSLDGSKVGDAYWNDNDIESISKYCADDVFATMHIVARIKGTDLPGEYKYTIVK